jgi:hypothetical protein
MDPVGLPGTPAGFRIELLVTNPPTRPRRRFGSTRNRQLKNAAAGCATDGIRAQRPSISTRPVVGNGSTA